LAGDLQPWIAIAFVGRIPIFPVMLSKARDGN
jgi:hypothetical protein